LYHFYLFSTAPRLTAPTGGALANTSRDNGSPGMRRVAYALLVFGLIAGVTCTNATLQSLKEEQSVVQLAQMIITTEKEQKEAREAHMGVKQVEEALSVITHAQEKLSECRSAEPLSSCLLYCA
jgi:hypothetical protein